MMENKFTPRAEEALRLAQEAAEDMGHGYVGSEHLLLGLRLQVLCLLRDSFHQRHKPIQFFQGF